MFLFIFVKFMFLKLLLGLLLNCQTFSYTSLAWLTSVRYRHLRRASLAANGEKW
jgi:hypothetical protein